MKSLEEKFLEKYFERGKKQFELKGCAFATMGSRVSARGRCRKEPPWIV